MSRRMKAALKRAGHVLLVPLARQVARRPRLKRLARSLLGRIPALGKRINAMIGRTEPLPPRRMHVPQDSADLSPLTRAAYDELRRRFQARKS